MLAYVATKAQFLEDAPVIEDKVREAVKSHLKLRVGDAEYQAWRNSLGNAMSHVMRDRRIPDDAAVAVEYRLNGRRFRIDFLIAGITAQGTEGLVIVELKQWTDILDSDLGDHVRTFVGGAVRDVPHPSYQAHSYASHLMSFNEYVYSHAVKVSACAYLHNCTSDAAIRAARFSNLTAVTPTFIRGDLDGIVRLVSATVHRGSGTDVLHRIDGAPIRPSAQLADAVGGMLKGREEFVLVDDQKTVLERIIRSAARPMGGAKRVMIIRGGPGTGKSVIAINALARTTAMRLNTKYVTPNAAPRAVFEQRLRGDLPSGVVDSLFSGSAAFTSAGRDAFDALIVDEAHRLKLRSQYSKGGVNQIKEIIDATRTAVFFIDEAQKVTWQDIGDIAEIEAHARRAGADIEHLELSSQFRCGGSDDYLVWLDFALGIKKDDTAYFSTDRYDFRIFDDPRALHDEIRRRNEGTNRARMVAGYCWNWVSKKERSRADLVFPEFAYEARWNLESHGSTWIIEPDSVSEVGCIHTSQGLELDYVGVIIGPDLFIRSGELATDPTARAKTDKSLHGFKKHSKEYPAEAAARADAIIRNTYRTLMSRGMKGCYIYCTDTDTAQHFRRCLGEI